MIGTKSGIEQYTKHLSDNYNIELRHQIPNSPETNMLDLGVWATVQCAVEKLSIGDRYDPNVLAKTVMKAWDDELSTDVLEKIYQRWERVLTLIQLDNGGNRFVEMYRGKLTKMPEPSNDTTEDWDIITDEARKYATEVKNEIEDDLMGQIDDSVDYRNGGDITDRETINVDDNEIHDDEECVENDEGESDFVCFTMSEYKEWEEEEEDGDDDEKVG